MSSYVALSEPIEDGWVTLIPALGHTLFSRQKSNIEQDCIRFIQETIGENDPKVILHV